MTLKKLLCSTFAAATLATAAMAATVNVGVTNSPSDLNPIDPGDSMATVCAELLYSPLVTLTDKLTYQPMLAEKVQEIDSKHFRVTLRDAKWTDGQPITADDVLFTVRFLTDPKVNSMVTQYYSVLEGFDEHGVLPKGAKMTGVKKIDGRTVEFICKQGMSFNMFNDNILRALLPVPAHLWKNFSPATYKQEAELAHPTVTSGPMTFVQFDKDHFLKLKSNKGYFLGAPKVDGVTFKVMSGPELTVAFAAGDIDMNVPMNGMIPSTDYEKVKSLKNVRTISGGPGTVQLLFLNNDRLSSPQIRQAISLAIDRETIVKQVLLGQGEPTASFFTSASPYRDAKLAPAYDPQKAKKMLQDAGFDFNKSLEFTVPTGNTTREQVAQVIQANLAAIGVKVDMLKFDFPTVMSRAKEGAFDMIIMADTLVPLNPTYDLQFFITKGNYNRHFTQKMDDLVAKMMTETDDAALKTEAADLQKLLWDDMPMMSLYAAKDLYAVSNKMKVGQPHDYGMFADLYQWEKED